MKFDALDLEALIDEIQEESRARIDTLIQPRLRDRPYVPRARPKTVIVSRAAQEAIETREWTNGQS